MVLPYQCKKRKSSAGTLTNAKLSLIYLLCAVSCKVQVHISAFAKVMFHINKTTSTRIYGTFGDQRDKNLCMYTSRCRSLEYLTKHLLDLSRNTWNVILMK